MTTLFSLRVDHAACNTSSGEDGTSSPAEHVGEHREPLQVAASRTLVNASIRSPLSLSGWQVRGGADDHKRYASKGGC